MADTVECELLAERIVIPAAHLREHEVAAVQVEPCRDLMLRTVSADKYVGKSVSVHVGNVGRGAVNPLETALCARHERELTVAVVAVDEYLLAVARAVARVAGHEDVGKSVAVEVGGHAR